MNEQAMTNGIDTNTIGTAATPTGRPATRAALGRTDIGGCGPVTAFLIQVFRRDTLIRGALTLAGGIGLGGLLFALAGQFPGAQTTVLAALAFGAALTIAGLAFVSDTGWRVAGHLATGAIGFALSLVATPVAVLFALAAMGIWVGLSARGDDRIPGQTLWGVALVFTAFLAVTFA
jgi:hypothetical protein